MPRVSKAHFETFMLLTALDILIKASELSVGEPIELMAWEGFVKVILFILISALVPHLAHAKGCENVEFDCSSFKANVDGDGLSDEDKKIDCGPPDHPSVNGEYSLGKMQPSGAGPLTGAPYFPPEPAQGGDQHKVLHMMPPKENEAQIPKGGPFTKGCWGVSPKMFEFFKKCESSGAKVKIRVTGASQSAGAAAAKGAAAAAGGSNVGK